MRRARRQYHVVRAGDSAYGGSHSSLAEAVASAEKNSVHGVHFTVESVDAGGWITVHYRTADGGEVCK